MRLFIHPSVRVPQNDASKQQEQEQEQVQQVKSKKKPTINIDSLVLALVHLVKL